MHDSIIKRKGYKYFLFSKQVDIHIIHPFYTQTTVWSPVAIISSSLAASESLLHCIFTNYAERQLYIFIQSRQHTIITGYMVKEFLMNNNFMTIIMIDFIFHFVNVMQYISRRETEKNTALLFSNDKYQNHTQKMLHRH